MFGLFVVLPFDHQDLCPAPLVASRFLEFEAGEGVSRCQRRRFDVVIVRSQWRVHAAVGEEGALGSDGRRLLRARHDGG